MSLLTRWLIIAGVGIALLAGITIQTLRLRNAELRITAARSRAAAAEGVVTRLREDHARAARLVADYAAEIAALQEREREHRNAIVGAPATSACADSPAIRVLLDRLRREHDAAATGRSPAAR